MIEMIWDLIRLLRVSATYRKGKSVKKLLVGIVAVVSLTGCATARAPVTGFWYTEVKSGEMSTGYQAGAKRGEACASSILGLIATGDASIEAARKNGGINYVISVDSSSSSILGIYAKYCTIVYGK